MAFGTAAHAAERPAHTALVGGEHRLTDSAFDALVNRVAVRATMASSRGSCQSAASSSGIAVTK